MTAKGSVAVKHGHVSGYRRGCRCGECRAANTAAQRAYVEANRATVNATRRLRYEREHERIRTQQRESYMRHRETRIHDVRRWRVANRSAHLAGLRRYYRENREALLAYKREHIEVERENHRKYREANPERFKSYDRRKYARRKGAPGQATGEATQARIDYFGRACWICRGPFEAVDHVKPLSRGGSNWPANLRPICHKCNSSKGNRWPLAGT